MTDAFILGSIAAAVLVGLAGFVVYGIYGGTESSLSNAKPGEIYNFEYLQPVTEDPKRFLAKVLTVRSLDDGTIQRLNARSNYRRYDYEFARTNKLVTCQTPDGKIRNFYAERTINCRKPLLAGTVFKTSLAGLLF